MLRDGDGVIGVIVIAADLLHVKMSEDSSEDDIEELSAVGILHDAHIGYGDCGLGAIYRPGHHDRNGL